MSRNRLTQTPEDKFAITLVAYYAICMRLGGLFDRYFSPSGQHFRKIGTVGLVFRLVENELDRATDAEGIFGDEEGAVIRDDTLDDVSPEGDRAIERDREHEAHRCAALDAVDQQVGKPFDLCITDCVEALN